MNDILMHYGVGHLNGGHSGRYPWGSGDQPYQRTSEFASMYKSMKDQGMSDDDIRAGMGMTTTEFRKKLNISNELQKINDIYRAQELRDKGYGATEIARLMSVDGRVLNESTIRGWLRESAVQNAAKTTSTAEQLKASVNDKGVIDIGKGIELELGVSKTRLGNAAYMLKDEGYNIYDIPVKQLGTGHYTTVQVLAAPGITKEDILRDKSLIKSNLEYENDISNGKSDLGMQKPVSIDSKRIFIKYDEDGGSEKDGVIELRKGVDDISLGKSTYAQVRIAVDDKYFLKGMAVYSNDIPKGYDILVNSNKHKGTPIEDVFKKMKTKVNPETGKEEIDWDNPFGALIKKDGGQYTYVDKNGKEKLSAINKLKEEGDWNNFSKTLSSQFLSKQPLALINKQLDLSLKDKLAEYEAIQNIQQPELKKKFLISFAEECDKAAVDLKAAPVPGQSSKVILPSNDISDKEVYAPTYNTGQKVCLVRYPHEGIFQIAELTVNNNNKKVRSLFGNDIQDAIVINSKTANKLSGADFDGDYVTVLPISSRVRVQSKDILPGLKDFDPKKAYGPKDNDIYIDSKGETKYRYPVMKKESVQRQMGTISNLITDMTLKGANEDQLTRAVKHSMTIIDAEKHKLNYKQSYKENNIAELKALYQPKNELGQGGASTLFSRKKRDVVVLERKDLNPEDKRSINPITGEKQYENTGRKYYYYYKDSKGNQIYNPDGSPKRELRPATQKVTEMANTNNAHTLVSDLQTPQEVTYANYANKLKSLANTARKEYLTVKSTVVSETAKSIYAPEVAALTSKVRAAEMNRPKERQASIIANTVVDAKIKEYNLDRKKDKKEINKLQQSALAAARVRVGASKKDSYVNITEREWEAIQKGAVNSTTVKRVINNADEKKLKEMAMPRTSLAVSTAKQSQIRSMLAAGYTLKEVSESLGYSVSTISKYAKGD